MLQEPLSQYFDETGNRRPDAAQRLAARPEKEAERAVELVRSSISGIESQIKKEREANDAYCEAFPDEGWPPSGVAEFKKLTARLQEAQQDLEEAETEHARQRKICNSPEHRKRARADLHNAEKRIRLKGDLLHRYRISPSRFAELTEKGPLNTPSILPGILDPVPSLHLLVGEAEVGKTRLLAVLTVAAAAGVSPWPGAPALPARRVLFVSGELPERDIVDYFAWAADMLHVPNRDWLGNMDLIALGARDPILHLDREGRSALHAGLVGASDRGAPFGHVFLDSFSRLFPDVDENSSAEVIRNLEPFTRLAEKFSAYFFLIHHSRKPGYGGYRPSDPRNAPRGTSAFAAVSRVQMLLETVKSRPRRRKLSIAGNFILDNSTTFDVADGSSHSKSIEFFIPMTSFAGELDGAMPEGKYLSARAIAQAVQDARGASTSSSLSGSLRQKVTKFLADNVDGGALQRNTAGRWCRVAPLAPSTDGSAS